MAGRTAQEFTFGELAGLLQEYFDIPPDRVVRTSTLGDLALDSPGLLEMSVAVEERVGRLGNWADRLSPDTTMAAAVRIVNAAVRDT